MLRFAVVDASPRWMLRRDAAVAGVLSFFGLGRLMIARCDICLAPANIMRVATNYFRTATATSG
jgi:hypothetical protein